MPCADDCHSNKDLDAKSGSTLNEGKRFCWFAAESTSDATMRSNAPFRNGGGPAPIQGYTGLGLFIMENHMESEMETGFIYGFDMDFVPRGSY